MVRYGVISTENITFANCPYKPERKKHAKKKEMTRKKKPLPVLENITITDIAAEGKSLARINDMVVFVPFAVPGDVVDLQVRRKKHHYCEAEVIRFIKYSELRIQRTAH